jgi:general secretion pathway protein F
MPIYKYRAKKGPEKIVEGTVEANTEREAIEKITQLGYIPVRVEESRGSFQTKPTQHILVKPQGKVRSREITVFSRQLASLLKSGVPILSSINIIAEQSESPNLKSILYSCHKAVKEGVTLSSALAQYPNVFSSLYIAMVHAGEDSGALPEVLFRIADYRAKEDEMVSRFRMALAYPVLMAAVGIATIIFMLTFVMPRLMRIFVSMGQDLPLPTRILISISQYLRQWWFWIIAGILVAILLIKRQAGTKVGKLSLSLFKLHFPVLGKFILKAELARFNRTLELLIRNGIPILKAIDIAVPVLENEVIKNQLRKSYKELEQGGSLGRSLENSRLFPLFMSNLIIVGEGSGRLEEALAEIASSYERDTDEAMRIMSSLLEPVMILVMGLIVGFIVIAMLLPIFEINVMAK